MYSNACADCHRGSRGADRRTSRPGSNHTAGDGCGACAYPCADLDADAVPDLAATHGS
jgi:hypothetical protein